LGADVCGAVAAGALACYGHIQAACSRWCAFVPVPPAMRTPRLEAPHAPGCGSRSRPAGRAPGGGQGAGYPAAAHHERGADVRPPAHRRARGGHLPEARQGDHRGPAPPAAGRLRCRLAAARGGWTAGGCPAKANGLLGVYGLPCRGTGLLHGCGAPKGGVGPQAASPLLPEGATETRAACCWTGVRSQPKMDKGKGAGPWAEPFRQHRSELHTS
jgi:hypothetical protein